MTLSKGGPNRGEARSRGGQAAAVVAEEEHDDSSSSAAATPYKGSRCCVGFFECHFCSHAWSSVFSWANTAQLCKPCSSKRRQTWVLPYKQISKSRKYEFFCIDCDKYIAESYRARDAHSGVTCKSCQIIVFPDWEFPCDDCNVVHLYSFSKTDAMRGIDCDCGSLLFPKHMKSLNRKHESQFCQKCQELGVNCCNFKAKQSVEEEEPAASVSSTAAATRKNKSTSGKSSSFKSGRPRKGRRSSVSSAEAAGESAGAAAAPEKKTVAQKKSSAPRRKPKTSVSSVEGDARQQQQKPSKNSVGKKSVPKPETGAGNQRRKPRVSFSSVEGEESEKKKKKPDKRRRRAPREENATTSEGEGEEVVAEVSGDEKTTTTTKAPRRRRSAPKGRKASGGEERGAEDAEEIVAETANRVAKAAPRGGRSGVRGSAGRGGRGGAAAAADPPNKLRVHVYGEDDVLRHARTPKNSVAMDPGIREPKIREPKISAGAKKPRQRQQKRPSIGRGDAAPVTEAEVDALADKVAESVILSAERVIVEENNNNNKEVDYDNNNNNNNNKAPRQQKDENDNSIILEKPKAMGDVKGVVTAATAAPATYEAVAKETALVSSASSSPLKTATGEAAAAGIAVELKGGHPPAVKVGGRRRVSSGRKSESEGKKPEVLAAAQPEGGAEVEVAANDAAMADPENYQVQVVSKSKSVNHSEMSSVPEKPSPTKEVNRMPKVHPHHPTNKHPIQQPRKC